MQSVSFRAGDTIIAEGDDGDTAFFIVSGSVEVSIGAQGEERIGTLGMGEVFGEMSLIEPGPRSATVRALTDTECLATSYEEFISAIEENPERAVGFMKTLVRRLRQMNESVGSSGSRQTGLARNVARLAVPEGPTSSRPRGVRPLLDDAVVTPPFEARGLISRDAAIADDRLSSFARPSSGNHTGHRESLRSLSSQPAPHAAAIVVIVLPERDAQTRFLERDDDQVHRRQGQDDERERQNLAERQRRAEVYEGHADVHRVARPGICAAGDKKRGLPDRIEGSCVVRREVPALLSDRASPKIAIATPIQRTPGALIQSGSHPLRRVKPHPARNATA